MLGLVKTAVTKLSSSSIGTSIMNFGSSIGTKLGLNTSMGALFDNLKNNAYGHIVNRAVGSVSDAIGGIVGSGGLVGRAVTTVTDILPSVRSINTLNFSKFVGGNLGDSIMGGGYTGRTAQDLKLQYKSLMRKSAYNFDKFGEHAKHDKNNNPFMYDMCYYPEDVSNLGDGHYLAFDIIIDTRKKDKGVANALDLDILSPTKGQQFTNAILDRLYGAPKRKGGLRKLGVSRFDASGLRVGAELVDLETGDSTGYSETDRGNLHTFGYTDTKTGRVLRRMYSGFRNRDGGSKDLGVKRIDSTILLGTPNQNHKFDYKATYSAETATGMAGEVFNQLSGLELQKGLGAFRDSIMESVKSLAPNVAGRLLRGAIGGLFPSVETLANISSGFAFNPNMEINFESVPFRSFSFTFEMIPRNRVEREQIEKIISLFKYHMMPDSSSSGRLYVPSEFQITYMYRQNENMFIPLISRCVLTDFSVDYAPDSKFATFYAEDLGAPPLNYKIDLTFKELEIMTKETIADMH